MPHDIPLTIMAYHNISPMPADHSMMTKGIKGSIRAEGHMDRPEVFSPSHHLFGHLVLLDSRCKPKPVKGTTDSHEEE